MYGSVRNTGNHWGVAERIGVLGLAIGTLASLTLAGAVVTAGSPPPPSGSDQHLEVLSSQVGQRTLREAIEAARGSDHHLELLAAEIEARSQP